MGRTPAVSVLSLLAFGSVLWLGCRILDLSDTDRYRFDLVYTAFLTAADTVGVGESFDVALKGWMPDPSWSFDHTEIKHADSLVTLRPIGRKDLTIKYVIMITVAWEDTVKLTLPSAGHYRLRVERPNAAALETRIVAWRPRCPPGL